MFSFGLYLDSISYILVFLAHLLKSHQLHQSQTLKSPVQTIIQPNQPNFLQNENVLIKPADGVVTQQHQLPPPPKRLLQNFVTPTPTPPTPPMPRANKREPMNVKFEAFSGNNNNKEEKVMKMLIFSCLSIKKPGFERIIVFAQVFSST